MSNRVLALESSLRGSLDRETELSRIVVELASRVATLERLLDAAARANATKEPKHGRAA